MTDRFSNSSLIIVYCIIKLIIIQQGIPTSHFACLFMPCIKGQLDSLCLSMRDVDSSPNLMSSLVSQEVNKKLNEGKAVCQKIDEDWLGLTCLVNNVFQLIVHITRDFWSWEREREKTFLYFFYYSQFIQLGFLDCKWICLTLGHHEMYWVFVFYYDYIDYNYLAV